MMFRYINSKVSKGQHGSQSRFAPVVSGLLRPRDKIACVIVAIFMVDGKSLMIAVASASLEEGAKRK